jgi:hypothetical protein
MPFVTLSAKPKERTSGPSKASEAKAHARQKDKTGQAQDILSLTLDKAATGNPVRRLGS